MSREQTDEKTRYQATLLANRLSRTYKQLRKWARRERVTCYRLYDKDIPEIPLAVDIYEFLPAEVHTKAEAAQFLRDQTAAISANDATAITGAESRRWLHLFLYERPYQKDESEEQAWLTAMLDAACTVLHIPRAHVITKLRKRQRGNSQYERLTETTTAVSADSATTGIGVVQECGELFIVNLRDYLDTGLFFDHRPLRALVRATANKKRVLNLFCYTGSFSVYAAEGGAYSVDSVDASNTYLDWARKNLALNGFHNQARYRYIRSDVIAFLDTTLASLQQNGAAATENRYDLIILDPPTFSNSKRTQTLLDINRDWSMLCTKCLSLLSDKGTLYFSTNSRRLVFDVTLLPKTIRTSTVVVTDITAQSLPQDFATSKNRRCWKIQLSS